LREIPLLRGGPGETENQRGLFAARKAGLRSPLRPYSAQLHEPLRRRQQHERVFHPVLHLWNGQTLGTRFFTWRKGVFVGTDEFGNKYYRYVQAQAIDSNVGAERRWVVYNGYADASKVPPGWRAWLCHNGDVPPSEESYKPHSWEKAYVPNLTGTAQAYRPQGSNLSTGQRPAATGDYVPWTPGE
jgi:NADH:ubiquinone oxidoreductase subunit